MATSSSPRRTPGTRTWPTVVLELVVVAGLFLAYRSARVLAGHSSAAAYDNARDLLTWERALPLPDELAVQQLLLTSETITRLANVYYATVHFPLTAAFLIWLFVRSRNHYFRIRTSLALLTGLALIIHAAFPLAPARMLDGRGFVDTAATYGPTVYDSPEADSLTNQFAAMPSLHFGWAVMVALGAIRASQSRYRVLWVAHPIITLLVIVGTANHYWLDAAVAGGLIIASEYALATWWRAARSATTGHVSRSLGRHAARVWPSPAPPWMGPAAEQGTSEAGWPAGQCRILAARGPPSTSRTSGPAPPAVSAAPSSYDGRNWTPFRRAGPDDTGSVFSRQPMTAEGGGRSETPVYAGQHVVEDERFADVWDVRYRGMDRVQAYRRAGGAPDVGNPLPDHVTWSSSLGVRPLYDHNISRI